MAKPLKINWSKIINNLAIDLPEDGLVASDAESMKDELQPETIGNLTRVTLDIFVFDNDDLTQAYMFENNDMRIYQDISFAQTLELIREGKKKKT